MAVIQHNQELFHASLRNYELKREDAMDCFHSIIDLVEKHFTKNDKNFVIWLNVSFEQLKKMFDYALLLEKIIIVQDYINTKEYLNNCAFTAIHKLIETICDL